MKDNNKTKKQLIDELTVLRSQNAALEKSESAEKYRSLVENIKDVIYELDGQGVVLYINPAVRNILGFDSTEIIGKNFTELTYKDDLSRLEEWFSELRKGRESLSEYRVRDKSGEVKWARTNARPIMEDGVFKGTRGILIDVTVQKRLVEALRESEEKYRWVLNNMADVITVMDMNLRFTYVSPSIMRMRGYTAEEAVAQTFEQVMTPESLQISAKVFEEEMTLEASGTSDPDRIRIVELEQYRKDGSIVLMENHLSIMRDESKKAVGIISVSHDVTERKQAEDKIKKQTDAMESAIDGIAILNKDEEYIYLNQAHARIYGYENAGELIAKPWRTLYDSDQLQRFDAEIMPKFSKEGFWQGEALGMKKDGSKFPQEISLTALDGGGLICIVRDITKSKQAEEALRHEKILYEDLVTTQPSGVYRLRVKLRGDWQAEKWRSMMESTYSVDMASDRFCNVLGISHEEFVAHPGVVPDVIHPDDKQDFNAKNAQAMTSLTPFTWEGRISRHHQTRWVHLESIPRVLDSETVLWTGIVYDVTERKRSEEELLRTLESLSKAVGTTIQVMVSAVEVRDPYTSGHQIRSADLASAIAMEMGLPQDNIEGIRMAGSIHDIGKLSIPAEILSKPTKLTNIEFSLIKEHSLKGYEILKDVESPWPLAQIVYQHHERMDGSGYPRNLKGDEILVEARIMAVADVVESMASHRPYRPSLGIEVALEEIEKNKGVLYDDSVADACLRLFREKGFQLLS